MAWGLYKIIILVLILFPWVTLFVNLGGQEPKKKRLEDLTDRELFELDVAVSNEVVRRGWEKREPFEELRGGRNNG